MKKTLFSILLLSTLSLAKAQELNNTGSKWLFGVAWSNDSHRYAKGNTNGLVSQLSVDRRLRDYLILGSYLGYQRRNYSFTSEYPFDPYLIKSIEYRRKFIPIGLRFGFDLTSFFHNQLAWLNHQDRWEILLLGYGGLTVNSEKILTPIISGEPIEWSEYQFQEDMNYIAGINAVIKYFPQKNMGIFAELGYGPVGRYSFGVAYRIR